MPITATIKATTIAPIASLSHGVFGRLRKKPDRPAIPATIPISTATMKNGAAYGDWSGGGRTYVQIRFDRPPVTAPAIGPARTPTRIVPIESRQIGTLRAAATVWPRMMLIAIAIGIRTIVRVPNWLVIDSSFRVCAYSVAP